MSRCRTESDRIRLAQLVYEEYMKKPKNKPVRQLKKENKKIKPKLNSYQEFVRQESKKECYKNLSGTNRLQAISVAWEKKKKLDNKLLKKNASEQKWPAKQKPTRR